MTVFSLAFMEALEEEVFGRAEEKAGDPGHSFFKVLENPRQLANAIENYL